MKYSEGTSWQIKDTRLDTCIVVYTVEERKRNKETEGRKHEIFSYLQYILSSVKAAVLLVLN